MCQSNSFFFSLPSLSTSEVTNSRLRNLVSVCKQRVMIKEKEHVTLQSVQDHLTDASCCVLDCCGIVLFCTVLLRICSSS